MPTASRYRRAHVKIGQIGWIRVRAKAKGNRINTIFSYAEAAAYRSDGEKGSMMMLRRLGNSYPSLAIRRPDILHLGSMPEEPAALSLLRIKPVDGAAFVGKHLFEIAD